MSSLTELAGSSVIKEPNHSYAFGTSILALVSIVAEESASRTTEISSEHSAWHRPQYPFGELGTSFASVASWYLKVFTYCSKIDFGG